MAQLRNGRHHGGLLGNIIFENNQNARAAAKKIYAHGTLVIDVCNQRACIHDGVTPGGCMCFVLSIPTLAEQIAALPVCAAPACADATPPPLEAPDFNLFIGSTPVCENGCEAAAPAPMTAPDLNLLMGNTPVCTNGC